MPIEVSDILPEQAAAPEQATAPEQAAAPEQAEEGVEASAEAPEVRCGAQPAPAPKRRGRPPGSKNKLSGSKQNLVLTKNVTNKRCCMCFSAEKNTLGYPHTTK